MDAPVAARDSANQVTIELLLFLFSSQGCTCQREWRRGSSRRTRYHVGGKKATSFSFEWVFSGRCIRWREGSCGRFAVTRVRRFLIKSGRFWCAACCSRDASAVKILLTLDWGDDAFSAVEGHLLQPCNRNRRFYQVHCKINHKKRSLPNFHLLFIFACSFICKCIREFTGP